MTPPVFDLATYVILFLIVAGFLASAIRILREYERGVLFTLGRFTKVSGPGLIIVIPIIQQIVRTDLRTFVEDVPSQDVISRDNVSVKVNAVIYFRIVNPEYAVIAVENYREATSQLAQTTLRSVLGKHELDEMLAERDRLNVDIQEILDKQTDAWGIKVSNVEIKHVDLDESHRPAGRGRAPAPRQGHQRRRRTAGRPETGRSRSDPRRRAELDAVAISRGVARYRRHEHVDRDLPGPDGPSAGADAPGTGQAERHRRALVGVGRASAGWDAP